MSMVESRRDFLKQTSKLLGGVAVLGGASMLAACGGQPAPAPSEAPAEPAECPIPEYPYKVSAPLDLDAVTEKAYKAFYNKDGWYHADASGCAFGTAYGLIEELKAKIGHPFDLIPVAMFANGAGGYGQQSLCGSLGGAVAVIGMVCAPKDAKAITKELMDWYKNATLPIYHPDYDFEKYTVCYSVNCKDSVGLFMKENGIEKMSDPPRLARCAGVCADTARKAAELLNIHFGFAAAAPKEEPKEEKLAENEFIGVGHGGFGGDVKVKVTMDGDKIAKIDILESGETLTKEGNDIIAQIIEKNSSKIENVAGATMSSKAISEAVADALSKIPGC